MKRIVKFRGKRLDNGKWVYGYFLKQTFCDGEGECSYIKIDGCAPIKVDPATVGQFTDLLDAIGAEIWEGDIVRRTVCMRDYAECDGVVDEIYEVEYAAPGWLPFLDISSRMDEYEVIGNIHDNPELINQ